ncbi:MAG: hypothetical protein DI537_61910, partial [Stutzerimonas stutzeri]
SQADSLHQAMREFTQAVRPNALAYVDGFGYEDYLPNSALGRADGNVYQSLLEWAKTAPLNKTVEGPAFEAVIKPAREALSDGLIADLSSMFVRH